MRTTFEGVPDAPISQAVISLLGGHGQNSATADSTPKIAIKCPKARKHHKKHKRHHARHAGR